MDTIGLKAILDDKNFQDGLQRYQKGIGQMEKSTNDAANIFSKAGSIMQGAFIAGIGAATVAIGAFVAASKIGLDSTLQWAEGLDTLGDRFGLTGEQGSAFQFLANKVGVSVDEMGMGLNAVTNGLQGIEDRLKAGSKTMSPFEQGLAKIGVSAFNSKGKLKTFDELLPDLMDAFNKLPPGIKASSVAMDLFGTRGGSKFLDFLRQGSKGLEDARKKAKELGLELSTDEVNAAEEFGFAMNELNLGIKGFWNQLGKQVLPIVRRFVDFVNERVIPVLAKWAKDYMPLIGRGLEFVSDAIDRIVRGDWNSLIRLIDQAFGREAANNVGQFINAASGVANAIGQIANAFKTGGLAGGLQAIGTQLSNAFKNIDWSAVSKNLDGLKSQFWTWLTGKGGVLEQVGSQLGKVVAAIGTWLSNSQNTAPIVKAVMSWVEQFWSWVTNPESGLIATVAAEMNQLIQTMKLWSELPDTKQQFREIGKTIANTVLDGIGRVFENPAEGRNLLVELSNTIRSAYEGLRNVFINIGSDIAHGVVEGIANRLFGPDTAARLASALDGAFNAMFGILSAPGGPIMGLAQRIAQTIFNALQAAFNALLSSWNPALPNPGSLGRAGGGVGGGGGSSGFAFGGPVGRTGMALVHAGEYVLNRQQAMQFAPMLTSPNNSRTYNFYHTWPAGVPASQQQWTEGMVRRVTQQEMRGILGKG